MTEKMEAYVGEYVSIDVARDIQRRLDAALAREEGLRKDAERWRAGEKMSFPEFCGHCDEAPGGSGWFHANLSDDQWFKTATEAMDALIATRAALSHGQEDKHG